MEAVSGQTGITVSCIQDSIQVYLKKNTIRIIITRIYNFFSEPVIDKNIIVFIHSWLVSMVTKLSNESESHMLPHDTWLLWTFLQP